MTYQHCLRPCPACKAKQQPLKRRALPKPSPATPPKPVSLPLSVDAVKKSRGLRQPGHSAWVSTAEHVQKQEKARKANQELDARKMENARRAEEARRRFAKEEAQCIRCLVM